MTETSNSNNKPALEWTDAHQVDWENILSVGEECISAEELKRMLLAKGRNTNVGFNLYDGFEPSGRMHIAQGVFKAMNVNKCTSAEGATFVFWVADWFALMNDKMGGDLEKIKIVGQYLIEVWRAAGMNLDHVVFKWASEEITQHASVYWPLMLDVARRFNITRIKKCCQIMGRLEGSLTAAQVLYPLMQCTDVFFLKADICQLGVDQRKVNMLAREYCDASNKKFKPIILSHHMLYGLKAGQEKMSKSDPDSAIFMEDTTEDVERKILQAYCPAVEEQESTSSTSNEEVDAGKASMHLTVDNLKNPCLDYIQHIIFSPPGATFTAAGQTFTDFAAVKDAFLAEAITEEALKRGLINELNRLLQPVRDHFTNDANAKHLLEQVQQFKKDAVPTSTTPRRLDLSSHVPANTHLVFAPLPNSSPTLQQAVDLLARIRAGEGQRKTVLYLSDWSAAVCNANQADDKVIAAFYTLLLASLRALDATLMESVHIQYQSQAILTDPSNYWISVINVGRHFMLDKVMGDNMVDSDGVGGVIARLMQVADIAGVAPASMSLEESNQVVAELVSEFFTHKLPNLTAPTSIITKELDVRLQPVRESDALVTENDEYYLTDDPAVNVKSKMKKAFCEPGNTLFCPPIALATVFCLKKETPLVISRSEENGGTCNYENVSTLEKDFRSEALHPGDLKAGVTTVVMDIFANLSSTIKADKEAMQASKTLKAFQKKMSKVKK
ncbi:tyrosyl-tRNA synthetase [Fistulifera solaris]|uniref:tyrosine--tRNA ligase n=1 Tax=Fistulifera solaris TaxID=1519565 RepID=A0A1Z5JJ48_FISSO|nr:tyrosyl-tRNA synthetase [Fistulifera solaris]|eukprot:GAX14019.1 tyrosyl-tRNA synthetase [Fistulifera solaris]